VRRGKPGLYVENISGIVLGRFSFFQRHIFKLAGLEDVPTLFAFDVFGVFDAGNDLHPGMLTRLRSGIGRGLRRLACRHRFRVRSDSERAADSINREICRILERWFRMSSALRSASRLLNAKPSLTCSEHETCRPLQNSAVACAGLRSGSPQQYYVYATKTVGNLYDLIGRHYKQC